MDQFLAMKILYALNYLPQQPRYLVTQVGKCRASVPAKTLEMLRENESWDFRVGMMNPKELCDVWIFQESVGKRYKILKTLYTYSYSNDVAQTIFLLSSASEQLHIPNCYLD